VDSMKPMFEPKMFKGKKRPNIGKYSFSEEARVRIFGFIIKEIGKHSDCPIALCKESAEVWNQLGLDLSRVQCVCQLDYADMTNQ
jgi:spore photoproduct lyase